MAGSSHWNQLRRAAAREVARILDSLPPDVQAAARRVPVTFAHAPSSALVADGIEADSLGLFTGPSMMDDEATGTLPPQITLFLDNIWDYAEADPAQYGEELRATLLHELGHYLGWEEDELEARGLE